MHTIDHLGIAVKSLAHARNEREFVDSFTQRIQALAKAHSLLTESRMQGALPRWARAIVPPTRRKR